jgi:hypothetical protein
MSPTGHQNIGMGQHLGAGSNMNLAPPAPPPSLEARLQFLESVCSRLGNVTSRIGIIADRIQAWPSNGEAMPEQPKPIDLQGRTAMAYDYIDRQVAQLETLAERLHLSLFDERNIAGAASPARDR